MAYAHARGVVHRDLKPSNVMVGAFGEVQVMDWGLAKVLPKDGPPNEVVAPPANLTVVATARSTGESDLSEASSVLGTPAYMAPEQARGETAAVDRRADVFALGSILCEIVTGAPASLVTRRPRSLNGATCRHVRGARSACALRSRRLSSWACPRLSGRPCEGPAGRRRSSAGHMNAYLAGVQVRLHKAELSGAAESATAGSRGQGGCRAARRGG